MAPSYRDTVLEMVQRVQTGIKDEYNKPLSKDLLYFTCVRGDWFRQSSVIQNTSLFCAYRGFIFLYFISWYIAQLFYLEYDIMTHYIYYTTWAETLLNIYFMLSFVLCIIQQFSKAEVQASNRIYLLQKICWFCRSAAFAFGMLTTIVYWSFMGTDFDAFSIHCHIINFCAICFDLVVCDIPFATAHVWVIIVVNTVYGSFTRVLWSVSCTEKHEVIYPGVIDFKYNSNTTLVFFAGFYVSMTILHLCSCLIYRIRTWVLQGHCIGNYEIQYSLQMADKGKSTTSSSPGVSVTAKNSLL